ncbi:MAG: response regulator [Bacteroidetes bacterium]|nr:response regulator [Bacteroidota bacterium]
MRLLLVEDDDQIARFVRQGLEEAGYVVDRTGDGEEGFRMGLNEDYDAAVVDLMLPSRDGLSLIQGWRQRGDATPVLILSAKRSVDERVEGLQAGGDDYLTKPFAFAELLARVQALVRRNTGTADGSSLTAGPIELDRMSRTVTRGGEEIDLQPREFSLLEFLVRNQGKVVSKTMILEHVWDFNFTPQTNVVEVLVHRLRGKIDEGFERRGSRRAHVRAPAVFSAATRPFVYRRPGGGAGRSLPDRRCPAASHRAERQPRGRAAARTARAPRRYGRPHALPLQPG